jgi:hypothetical protein
VGDIPHFLTPNRRRSARVSLIPAVSLTASLLGLRRPHPEILTGPSRLVFSHDGVYVACAVQDA